MKAWEQPATELPFDYDEPTGVKQWFSIQSDGSMQFRQELEVDYAALEAAKALAKDEDHWKDGVKNGWVHYAHIPDALLFLWHTMGVNINEPSELMQMVNRPEWSAWKLTDKTHKASANSAIVLPSTVSA